MCTLVQLVLALLQLAGVVSQMRHGSALPQWTPTWQMNRSTFLMGCNNSGPFSPEVSPAVAPAGGAAVAVAVLQSYSNPRHSNVP